MPDAGDERVPRARADARATGRRAMHRSTRPRLERAQEAQELADEPVEPRQADRAIVKNTMNNAHTGIFAARPPSSFIERVW